jgi:hypothetical protein
MKKIFLAPVVIMFLTSCVVFSSRAQQIEMEKASITVYAKTISVRQAFKLTDDLLSGPRRIYDRYVVKGNYTYYRAGVGVLRKPPIYVMLSSTNWVKLKRNQEEYKETPLVALR